ncbi:Microtubule-associated serine/threonine-protein kinase 1 [Dissostichus eleginoides]|uniref:Microtubule-associated serine/threonine-protein kinase 1 n=1 Tax=Dissostichus eleginoides TaxID=100907 RepID=A0AAD9BGR4_DISEL|nr:Microtubule-associated serine/threonine-protein kinase 1 [Dissostichus eleginoides]
MCKTVQRKLTDHQNPVAQTNPSLPLPSCSCMSSQTEHALFQGQDDNNCWDHDEIGRRQRAGRNGPFSIPEANSPYFSSAFTEEQLNSQHYTPTPPAFCGQVGRQPPSAAPDELVAMGTVNGLVRGDFGPDKHSAFNFTSW